MHKYISCSFCEYFLYFKVKQKDQQDCKRSKANCLRRSEALKVLMKDFSQKNEIG